MIIRLYYKDPYALQSGCEDAGIDVDDERVADAPGEEIGVLYCTEKRCVVGIVDHWSDADLMKPPAE